MELLSAVLRRVQLAPARRCAKLSVAVWPCKWKGSKRQILARSEVWMSLVWKILDVVRTCSDMFGHVCVSYPVGPKSFTDTPANVIKSLLRSLLCPALSWLRRRELSILDPWQNKAKRRRELSFLDVSRYLLMLDFLCATLTSTKCKKKFWDNLNTPLKHAPSSSKASNENNPYLQKSSSKSIRQFRGVVKFIFGLRSDTVMDNWTVEVRPFVCLFGTTVGFAGFSLIRSDQTYPGCTIEGKIGWKRSEGTAAQMLKYAEMLKC